MTFVYSYIRKPVHKGKLLCISCPVSSELISLNLSAAVTLFLKQSFRVQGLPFAVTRANPNGETAAALNEYYKMKAHPKKYKKYSSFKDATDT